MLTEMNASDSSALNDENSKLKAQLEQLKAENAKLSENAAGTSALNDENLKLREQISELNDKNARNEEMLEKLKTDREKLAGERGQDELLLAQIDKLQGTVDTYEKTFDEYANQRNAEVKDLNDELSALRKKYADLSAQMNEIVNDGQMTL